MSTEDRLAALEREVRLLGGQMAFVMWTRIIIVVVGVVSCIFLAVTYPG